MKSKTTSYQLIEKNVKKLFWMFFILISIFFFQGCDDSSYHLGSDTYSCSCTCVVPCAYRNILTGECLGDIPGWTIRAETCADDDAHAEGNCNADCLATLNREHSGESFYESYRGSWECLVNETRLTARDFCSLTDSSRTGWDREPLLASRTPAATFLGYADPGDSWVRFSNLDDGSEATVPVNGELSFYGGDCPGQSCTITMEYAYLYATRPFDLGSHRIEGLKIMNNGLWAGTKSADGTFTFEASSSSLNIAGLVDRNYNSLTANATDTGVTGELSGIEALTTSRDGRPLTLSVTLNGRVEVFYPMFFFEGTFRHDNIVTELHIVLDLRDGAPYAKAEQYYDTSDRLVLDGSKSSQYKCLWGYCEQRTGVVSVEVPAPWGSVEGGETVSVPVESRWDSLEVYWLDQNSRLLGKDLVIYPKKTPLYPVTLIVVSEKEGVKRVDTDILKSVAKRRFGCYLENDTYTITSLEGNSKTFKLPEANDKYAIKELTWKVEEFVKEQGGTIGQIKAARKKLTEYGYHIAK